MTAGPSLTERLAERLARPVDAATRARARLHLLDWLGCVGGARATAAGRLFANAAAMGNILEMDDVHRAAILHPGPVVWPSLTGRYPRTMADLLDAAVCGYEAMISVGCALDAHHYSLWHPTATVGTFGAAAAVARLEGLTVGQTADALGNAGSTIGGLWRMRHEDVLTKQFHIMQTVDRGQQAGAWAKAGVTGPRFILEGDQGVFAAFCRAPRAAAMFAGEGWRIHEVSFKPYAACRHAHAAIDAALELRARGALDGNEPILVATYSDSVRFCSCPEPRTEGEAKFSLHHAVALVAVRGAVALSDFGEAARADPALAAARARVSVAVDPKLDAAYPGHFGARVDVGGETAFAADALGDPERPMSRHQIVAKARALFAYGDAVALGETLIRLALDEPDEACALALVDAVEELVEADFEDVPAG